jgi:hypothetical protein
MQTKYFSIEENENSLWIHYKGKPIVWLDSYFLDNPEDGDLEDSGTLKVHVKPGDQEQGITLSVYDELLVKTDDYYCHMLEGIQSERIRHAVGEIPKEDLPKEILKIDAVTGNGNDDDYLLRLKKIMMQKKLQQDED